MSQCLQGPPAPYPLTDEEPASEDKVNIDLGYTNDHKINSSCCQPQLTALRSSPQPMDSLTRHFSQPTWHHSGSFGSPSHMHPAHASTRKYQPPVPPLGTTRLASASPLTCTQAHASTSKFQMPAPVLGAPQVVSAAPLICTQAHASNSKCQLAASQLGANLGSFYSPSHLHSGTCFHQQTSFPRTGHSRSQHPSRFHPKVNNTDQYFKASWNCFHMCYAMHPEFCVERQCNNLPTKAKPCHNGSRG